MAKVKNFTPCTSVGVTGYNVRISINDLYRLACLLNETSNEVDEDFAKNHPAITDIVGFVARICDNTIGNPFDSHREFDTFYEEDTADDNVK